MHAFDFILVLFSFVYAAAGTHVLSTAGEIIIASKRIRLSWFNAGWILVALAEAFTHCAAIALGRARKTYF
jgi:hypothetical protein